MTDLTLLAIDWHLAHAMREDVRAELVQRRVAYLKSNPAPQEDPPMNAHNPSPQPDTATRIAQFLALRAKIKEIEDRHEAELAPYKNAKAQLETILLQHLDAAGGDSIAARGVGTVYRTVKSSASLADPAQFRRFVVGGEHWDLLDWKANSTATEDFLRQNNQLPPGVNFSQKVTVGVRKA